MQLRSLAEPHFYSTVMERMSIRGSVCYARHSRFFYPHMCENVSCNIRDPKKLLQCSKCKMVQYCCREHQVADWPKHKEECSVFSRVGMSAIFYTDEDMLAKYPLKAVDPLKIGSDSNKIRPPEGSHCCTLLCHLHDNHDKLCYTPCCGNILCDNEDKSKVSTAAMYPRDFCIRSHKKYTLCGWHSTKMEDDGLMGDVCDRSVDWRVCRNCCPESSKKLSLIGQRSLQDYLWRGLNAYNFTPLLERYVPKHSRCSECGHLFYKSIEGGSDVPVISHMGIVGGITMRAVCMSCSKKHDGGPTCVITNVTI